MKIKIPFLIIFFLLAITLLLNNTGYANTERQKIIQTYGEAEITAQPDLAKISISIITRNQLASEAARENAKLANTVLKALLDSGLNEEEIKTSSYRLKSYYKWVKNELDKEQEQIYYQATNEILIKTTKLDSVGNIIDLAIEAGANSINYINFELRDPQKFMLEALTAAAGQAQSKAEAIAKGAGVTIKQLLSIKEEKTTYTPFHYQDTILSEEIVKSAAPTPIAFDSVIIRAKIRAEFSF